MPFLTSLSQFEIELSTSENSMANYGQDWRLFSHVEHATVEHVENGFKR